MAAGNEPFRLGNYSFHRTGQMAQIMYVETVEPSTLQPRARKCYAQFTQKGPCSVGGAA